MALPRLKKTFRKYILSFDNLYLHLYRYLIAAQIKIKF